MSRVILPACLRGQGKRPKKREDAAQAAVRVNTIAKKSEEAEEAEVEITEEMWAAFGRTGGKIGGPTRAASLSTKKRSEIAKKAAAARWKQET